MFWATPFFGQGSAAHDSPGDDIADWIIAKLLNSTAIARLVKAIDAQQSQILDDKNLSRLSRRLQSVARKARADGMLQIGSVIAKSVTESIRPVVLGVSQLTEVASICVDLEEAVNNYCDRWA